MRFAVLTAGAVAAGMLGLGAAEAATYSMSATCLSACADANLSVGDKLTGRLTIDSSTFTPNGSFGDAALQHFSITFGKTTVSSGDNVVSVHLDGQWGATRRDVPLYDLVGGTTVQPTIGATFLLSGANGFVSTQGSCSYGAEIHPQVAHLEHRLRWGSRRPRGVAQRHADAREQLLDAERLGEVVVGARGRARRPCPAPARAPRAR